MSPHAATLTALQRPLLTFGVIPTTITPYCHIQPPPSSQPPSPHLYCKQPPTDSGRGAVKPLSVSQLAPREQTEVTVNSKHSRHCTKTHTTPLPPHSSPSAASPVNFYSKLKNYIRFNWNCVATIPLFKTHVFFNEILFEYCSSFCYLSQEGSDIHFWLN